MGHIYLFAAIAVIGAAYAIYTEFFQKERCIQQRGASRKSNRSSIASNRSSIQDNTPHTETKCYGKPPIRPADNVKKNSNSEASSSNVNKNLCLARCRETATVKYSPCNPICLCYSCYASFVEKGVDTCPECTEKTTDYELFQQEREASHKYTRPSNASNRSPIPDNRTPTESKCYRKQPIRLADNVKRNSNSEEKQQKSTESVNKNLCLICNGRTATVKYIPCQDICLCKICFDHFVENGVDTCPKCTEKITDYELCDISSETENELSKKIQ